MSGFSTRSEETIERKLDVTLSTVCKTDEELIEKYDLWKCTKWISDNQFEKVCLQFPDSLLNDSVEVSLWLEKQIGKKCYILGDTSYGSCCTDEVAAEHINSDAIIHFGHSCLSPTVRLPVCYVFPKCEIDINKFLQVLREHCTLTQAQTVLIFDVSYCHYIGVIKNHLEGCDIVIAEPLTNGETCVNSCSKHCQLLNGETKHSVIKLGQSYCLGNDNSELTNIVFIGSKDSRTLYNFRISFTGPVYCYTESDGLESVSIGKSLQRRWYLMERIKDAKTIGIVICTLGVSGYLEAIKRISTLIRRKGKKCYVISVGKPTVAKLANFPEIEIYVMVSCPEAVLENEKDFYQPIVSVMEAEMALNEARSWSEISSSDFRDIIPGGVNYVDIPDNSSGDTEPDVSLVSNKIRYNHNNELKDFSSPDLCGTVQLRSDMTVDMMSSNLANRSWHGLDPSLGEVPVSKAVQGRSGIPQAYSEEEKHTML